MLPQRQITPEHWMTDYKTVKIMQVLGGYDLPAQSLFVGGCVRNALLGRPVKDIDIATIHHPLTVIEKLEGHGIRCIPTGLGHGTVTALIENATFEITTLRKDIETDGRHAVIAFTESWMEDAHRRDFTINTLLASPDGMIFDPTGQGLLHLDERKVVFVGVPSERIAEDYLRMLRFFRFHALYGVGPADDAALKACSDNADHLKKLSKERVTQELLKILMVPDTAVTLSLMLSCNILLTIAKDYSCDVMQRLCDLQSQHTAQDVLTRLIVLCGLKLRPLRERLVLSNAQFQSMENILGAHALLKTVSKKKMRETVYKHGNDFAVQGYFLRLAIRSEFPDLELLDIARYWKAPAFPVTGNDLIAQGMIPGPELGKRLQGLENKWIKSDFNKVPKY